MKNIAIELIDNEYVVYESHSPNWKTEVFRGSLLDCEIIANAYLFTGYVPVGRLANNIFRGGVERMTLERAAEIVCHCGLNNNYSNDLFCHFVEYFNLRGIDIKQFAILCGYQIATMAKKSD